MTNACFQHKIRQGVKSALIFWMGMTFALLPWLWIETRGPTAKDLIFLASVCLVAGVGFALALSVLRPKRNLLILGPEDGEDGLGVVARLIPPSPVLGAHAFPHPDEETA